MANVLLIEDEPALARFVALDLEHEQYQVTIAHDGRDGLTKALEGDWDIILLDLMLPGISGLEICRRVRQASDVPIIMLTARGETIDKVAGLDSGADDYLAKPFEIEELLARIRVQLRRERGSEKEEEGTDQVRVGSLVIMPESRLVKRGDVGIELTAREFDLLLFLCQNKNHVLTREQILQRVWGYDYLGDSNVVDVYIRYLRAKVDDPYEDKLISTVRGVGYVVRERE